MKTAILKLASLASSGEIKKQNMQLIKFSEFGYAYLETKAKIELSRGIHCAMEKILYIGQTAALTIVESEETDIRHY